MQFDKRTASATTSTPLGSTLTALGFNARPGLYDRLFSCPDAVPFLLAVASTFDPACVLSQEDATCYAHLISRVNLDNQNQDIADGAPEQPSSKSKPPPLLTHEDALHLVHAAQLNFTVDSHPDKQGDDRANTQLASAMRARLEYMHREIDAFGELLDDDEDNDDDDDDCHNGDETGQQQNLENIIHSAIGNEHDTFVDGEYDEDEDDVDEENDPIDDVIALREDLTSLLYAVNPSSPRSDVVGPYVAAERDALEHVLSLARQQIAHNDKSAEVVIATPPDFGQKEALDLAENGTQGNGTREQQQHQQQQRQQREDNIYQAQASLIDSYARLRAQTFQQRVQLLLSREPPPILSSSSPTVPLDHNQRHLRYPSSPSSSSSSSTAVSYNAALRRPGPGLGSVSPSVTQRNVLAAQFEQRCASIMAVVEQRARVTLSDAIASVRAHGVHKRREQIASHLSTTVMRLVEQRVRITCISLVQKRAAQARLQLFDALRVISMPSASASASASLSSSSQSVVKQEHLEQGYEVGDDKYGNRRMQNRNEHQLLDDSAIELPPDDFSGSSRGRSLITSCVGTTSVEDALAVVDKECADVIDEVLTEVAYTLDSFRTNIGCRRAWLDIDLEPGTALLTARLDEELGCIIRELETLLHTLERLQQE